jgi:hypothetical protein
MARDDEDDVFAHLLRRAESARDPDGSRLLGELTALLRAAAAGGPLVLRCAWCGRFEVHGDWVALGAEEVELGGLADAVTHGVCVECFEQFRVVAGRER